MPKPQEEIKGAEDTMTMASVKHLPPKWRNESAQRCSNNNDGGLVLGHDLVHGNVLVLCRCVGRVVSVGHADPLCDYGLMPPCAGQVGPSLPSTPSCTLRFRAGR